MSGHGGLSRFPSADELAKWLRPSNDSEAASRRQQAIAELTRQNPEAARDWLSGLLADRRYSVSGWALSLSTEMYGKEMVPQLLKMLNRRGEIQTDLLVTLRELNVDALRPYLPRIRRWLRRSYGHPLQYLPIIYLVAQLRDRGSEEELRTLRSRADVMPLVANVADFALAYIRSGPRGLAEAVRDCADPDRLYGAKYLVSVGGLPQREVEDSLREIADATTGDSRERCLEMILISQRRSPFAGDSP